MPCPDLLIVSVKCPLADTLGLRAKQRGVNTLSITADELVRALRVNDHVSPDGNIYVEWSIAERTLTSDGVTGVFNYLGAVPFDSLGGFLDEDRQYVYSELTAYLGFALSQFKNVINPPSNGAVSGAAESLPFQWTFVTEHSTLLKVPSFDIRCSVEPHPDAIMTFDFFDYSNWIPTPFPLEVPEEDVPLLHYSRPTGYAVVCWFIDDRHYCFSPLARMEVAPDQIHPDFREAMRVQDLLAAMFHLRLGQSIMFVSSSGVTFGSVMPYISFSHAPPQLQDRFVTELLDALLC